MSDQPTPDHHRHQHRADTHPKSTRERMTMPENHLDTVVTTNSIDTDRRASLVTKLLAVVLLPLFMVTGFTIAYNSALHAPKPHDMAITIAGPADTTKQIAAAVNKQAEHAFDITRTTSASAAKNDVKQRNAVGAIIIDGDTVTTITASAGGAIASAPVQQIGQQVAAQLGTTTTVENVAPTAKEDSTGTALFYFIILCTVGGYLSITVITQAIPKTRTRAMMITGAIASVLTPIIGFAMLSIFVGDFGATFGTIAAVIGVGMLYTFTVAMVAVAMTQALGQGAIFGVLLLLMFLNFPSTGGSAPESMLPPFWQVIHNTWVGSGAFESMRSIVYFDGAQVGRWFGQLSIWAGAATAAALLLGVVGHRRRDNSAEDETNSQNESSSREVAGVGGAF